MFTVEPAKIEQMDELLNLIYHQATPYLRPTLDLIQMTWDQFGQYFRTTGVVYRLNLEDRLVGICWVEERCGILYLHGLMIDEAFQGLGIGTQTLKILEAIYQDRVQAIELRVHASNYRAKALYERCGFITLYTLEEAGFHIMQKRLCPARDRQFSIMSHG